MQAARPTAPIVSEQNKNGSDAPNSTPAVTTNTNEQNSVQTAQQEQTKPKQIMIISNK